MTVRSSSSCAVTRAGNCALSSTPRTIPATKAAHEHGEAICTLVEITGARSHFPCFEHMPVERIIPRLRDRLFLHRKADQVEAETRRVIEVAREHKGTRYYDYFQNKQQGYAI